MLLQLYHDDKKGQRSENLHRSILYKKCIYEIGWKPVTLVMELWLLFSVFFPSFFPLANRISAGSPDTEPPTLILVKDNSISERNLPCHSGKQKAATLSRSHTDCKDA